MNLVIIQNNVLILAISRRDLKIKTSKIMMLYRSEARFN